MTNVTVTEADVLLLTGLTATATIRGVDLKWDDATPGDDYNSASIYRSDTDVLSASVKIGTAKQATQYMDNTVNANQTYYYWIRAVDDFNAENGAYEPAGPTGVSVTSSQATTADIKLKAVTDYHSNSIESQTIHVTDPVEVEFDILKMTLDYTSPSDASDLEYVVEMDQSIHVNISVFEFPDAGQTMEAFIEFKIENITDSVTLSYVSQSIWVATYIDPLWQQPFPSYDNTGFIYWRHILDDPGELLSNKLYRMTMNFVYIIKGPSSPPYPGRLIFNTQSRTQAIKPYKR